MSLKSESSFIFQVTSITSNHSFSFFSGTYKMFIFAFHLRYFKLITLLSNVLNQDVDSFQTGLTVTLGSLIQ